MLGSRPEAGVRSDSNPEGCPKPDRNSDGRITIFVAVAASSLRSSGSFVAALLGLLYRWGQTSMWWGSRGWWGVERCVRGGF